MSSISSLSPATVNASLIDPNQAAKPAKPHHHHHKSGAEPTADKTGTSAIASSDPISVLTAAIGSTSESGSNGSASGDSSSKQQQYSNPLLGNNIDLSA